MNHRFCLKLTTASAALTALTLVGFVPGTLAAETEYNGTWCGHSKSTLLVASPELTVFAPETWAIEVPGSTPKVLANSAVHCVGYYRIMAGQTTAVNSCRFTDPTGDSFTGEARIEPGKPNVWTFLNGTGKWKGIKGTGSFESLSRTKPRQDGSELCMHHWGAYTLSQ